MTKSTCTGKRRQFAIEAKEGKFKKRKRRPPSSMPKKDKHGYY